MKSSVHAMKTNRSLTMTPRQLFWYWLIILFFLAAPIYITVDLIRFIVQGKGAAKSMDIILFGYAFLLPAFIFHWVQKKHLQFKALHVRLNEVNFQEVVQQAANFMEWKIVESSDSHLIAKNPKSYRSIGERITVFREGNQVFFNSVGNPDSFYTLPYTSLNQRLRTMFESQVKELVTIKQLASIEANVCR